MKQKTIRVKLTILNFIIMGIFISVFAYLLYITLSGTLNEELDMKLQSIAEAVASSSAGPTLPLHKSPSIDDMLDYIIGMRSYGKFIQIMDRSGNVGERSKNLERRNMPARKESLYNAARGLTSFETLHLEGEKYPIRLIIYPNFKYNRLINIIQVGSSMENIEETLDRFSLILFLLVPCALVIISFSGWFMASSALKPVDAITKAVRKMTAENLTERIQPTGADDEIGRLADTFNDMISRLEVSFNQILQFSADVSHELRTPLTILKGGAEVALRRRRSPEEYEELILSNLEEINRMQRIVEDLLLLSRADMGEISVKKERLDLNKILGELKHQAEILALDKNLTVELDLKSVIILYGDELRIRQLLLNIISNAEKYSNDGGRVVIKAYEEGDYVFVSVTDTGIGIDEKDIPNIFNRFFRVDKARTGEAGGTGLGLSICKWIAREHGGDILVESEIGKGSTFTVKLAIK